MGFECIFGYKKNGWPANEFIDWFMRVYPNVDEFTKLSFELFLTNQFDWVYEKNTDALNRLYERISQDNFQSQDKDGLTIWVKRMYDGANNQ